MVKVYISLGSNIHPEKNILKAVRLLAEHVKVVDVSTVYRTEPLGGLPQPDFYNCVVKVETDVDPRRLKFGILRSVEERLGRKREKDKYAPRTIDIDILAYGDLDVSTEDVTIPDRDVMTRPFLATPLSELSPDTILPHANKPIREIADQFKNHRMIPLREYSETVKQLVRTMGESAQQTD